MYTMSCDAQVYSSDAMPLQEYCLYLRNLKALDIKIRRDKTEFKKINEIVKNNNNHSHGKLPIS